MKKLIALLLAAVMVLSLAACGGSSAPAATPDAPASDAPATSGKVDVSSRSISKRGSASLRKTLFQIMTVIIQKSPPDEPVYQFLDRKRVEGKPYKVYMIAAANKFLRIYYARVKACVESSAVSD